MKTLLYIIKHEKVILLSFIAFALLNHIHFVPEDHPLYVSQLLFLSVFFIMMYGVFNVVKHAHVIAEILGEPFGTLILTLSVIIVEVALIMAVMLAGKAEPTLARDTMFSVIMIAINGFAGLSLLIGGIKHRFQEYHLGGANAYLALLIPLAVFCLILPNTITTASGGQLSNTNLLVISSVCVILYSTFLVMQTVTHSDYFTLELATSNEKKDAQNCSASSASFHIVFLVLSLVGMILLSKKLAIYLDYNLTASGLPMSLSGFIIAFLILMPEGYSAVFASLKNQLQKSVNLCLGSALASICLTIPAVALISLLMGKQLLLGLSASNATLLGITLLLSITTFTGKTTNFLNGAVHLAILFVYFALLFH